MILYEAMIPLDPKTKKNNMEIKYRQSRGGYAIPFISQSETYKQYERDCGFFLKKLPKPINETINIRYTFYRQSQRRCDLSNLIASIDDILVKYGVIEDDNYKIIAGHDGSRVRIDKDKPRTEIIIERLQE